MLGDAAGLACGHLGLLDGIENGGLAVVNMAHNDHNGSAGLQLLGSVLRHVDEALLDGEMDLFFDLCIVFHGNEGGGIEIDGVAKGGHDAVAHQLLDDFGTRLLQAGGKLRHGDLIGDGNLQDGLLGSLLLAQAGKLLRLGIAALGAGCLTAVILILLLDFFLGICVKGALGHQLIDALIVLAQVDVGNAGVHHALLGLLAGNVCLGLLLRGGRRRRGRGFRRGSCCRRINGCRRRSCRRGLLLCRGCGSLRRGRFLAGCRHGCAKILHLVALGQRSEDNIELALLQHLLIVLRRHAELAENLGNLL